MTEIFDTIIIGAGPAGLTGAIYTARSMLSTCIIEQTGTGGSALVIDQLENYPGFHEGISGYELASRMEQQAKKFGAKIIADEVLEISGKAGSFIVKCPNALYKTRTILIATGSKYKKLDIVGEKELAGRGVSYCATCDGAFFKGQKVAVIGGGNSALQEAGYLSRIASEVHIIHRRDAYRASKLLQQRISQNPKIKQVLNSIVTKINGSEKVESLLVKNVKTNNESVLPVEGVFVAAGHIPNTGFCKNLVDLDEKGYIIVDETLQTSVPGIFAAGDCRVTGLRQVATAVGDGAFASESIDKILQKLQESRE